MSGLFDELPRAKDDNAVLYVMGSGFGESQVIHFPDGRVVVIDCCIQEDVCLPAALLDWLGVDGIDLLVITHPDMDHIDGLDQLLTKHKPRRAWRYPGFADLGEWIARWLEHGDPSARRLERLRLALQAFDDATSKIEAPQVCYGFREWPGPHHQGRVVCLAPPSGDVLRAARPLSTLIRFEGGRPEIDEDVLSYLMGETTRIDRHGNRLSLALAVRWGIHRVLLAGDVESGAGPRSGWRGILTALREDQRQNEITDLSLAKAAHHGSKHAWCDELWELAALSDKVPVLVVTRFDRGANPPPHAEVLRSARTRAAVLSLTSDSAHTRSLRVAESWVNEVGQRAKGTAACVAIDLPSHAPPTVHLSGASGAWT